MQYFIDVSLAETPAARAWLDQFQTWLDVVPEGVTVSLREQNAMQSNVIAIDELVDFFRPRLKPTRVWYNARSVLYYFVEHLNHLVVVRCTECSRQYGVCRCEDRGCERGDRWWYNQYLFPDTNEGQRFWVLERASVKALDESQLPVDHSQIRRQRLLEFLRHQKEA